VGVPLGAYVPVSQVGSLLFLSGLLPRQGDQISYQGKLGRDLTVEQGYEAARLCALNALSVLKSFLGSLDRIRKIVRLVGYLQTDGNFQSHPQV
jgi:enamine deaminase RidA (YjgF/YER057c/UK114 family)